MKISQHFKKEVGIHQILWIFHIRPSMYYYNLFFRSRQQCFSQDLHYLFVAHSKYILATMLRGLTAFFLKPLSKRIYAYRSKFIRSKSCFVDIYFLKVSLPKCFLWIRCTTSYISLRDPCSIKFVRTVERCLKCLVLVPWLPEYEFHPFWSIYTPGGR